MRKEIAPPGSASEHDVEVLGMSVQLEAEAAQLTGQDRVEMPGPKIRLSSCPKFQRISGW